MNLGPKKDGSPNVDFFQSSESIQGFESVRLWLQKNHKKVSGKIRKKMSPLCCCGFLIFEKLIDDSALSSTFKPIRRQRSLCRS